MLEKFHFHSAFTLRDLLLFKHQLYVYAWYKPPALWFTMLWYKRHLQRDFPCGVVLSVVATSPAGLLMARVIIAVNTRQCGEADRE